MIGAVISMVESATETTTRDIGIDQVLTAIRTGGKKLLLQIDQIRDKLRYGDATAKKLAGELKKQLPAVMWSGTFSQRANDKLMKHSGLLCADLDSLGAQMVDVREKLQKSPHVVAAFLSPSGDGLKAVFRVPADATKHEGSFRAIEKHIKELTAVQIDKSGKDVSRLCFVSYDPDLYLNENAIEIEPLP
jgi:hypothetical protein